MDSVTRQTLKAQTLTRKPVTCEVVCILRSGASLLRRDVRLFNVRRAVLSTNPADETPLPSCDVYPEDYDVALAVDHIEKATTLSGRHIRRKWAGCGALLQTTRRLWALWAGMGLCRGFSGRQGGAAMGS